MESKAGAQISQRGSVQSVQILFVLMIGAGVLPRLIPAGSYEVLQVEGRSVAIPQPDYPVWRWFTAPLEVLSAEGGA